MCKKKFTIKDFNERYSNDNARLDEIFINRYGNEKECPNCEKPFKCYRVTDRKCYACAWCGHHIYPLVNTIFHNSSTSLELWFYAIFLFSTSKNGVAAKELERQLGVTYKTAWRMAKQIRKLFDETVKPLSNTVELDETYHGVKEKNKHDLGSYISFIQTIDWEGNSKGKYYALGKKPNKKNTLKTIRSGGK